MIKRNKKYISVIVWLLLLTTGNKVLAQSRAEEEISSAVAGLTKAMIDADTIKLSQLTSDQLSYGHSHGNVQNKSQFIHSLATGESDFVTINLTNPSITISENTAIVRHTLEASTNDRGKPGNVRLYVLLVWQKLRGRWLLLARQAVPAPQSSN
jgi:hypothetical protein